MEIYRRSNRTYFDFSADFVYIPLNFGKIKDDLTRSTIFLSFVLRHDRYKVKNLVYEVHESWEGKFSDIALYFPNATRAILVPGREGMPESSTEQANFSLIAHPFLWQKGRSLYGVYHNKSKTPDAHSFAVAWNLRSIERATFSIAGREA